MKVPINACAVINLDAPTLPAERIKTKHAIYWRVWCEHCEAWHLHGAGEGHREAHCDDARSPYWKTGYNLAGTTQSPR